MSSSSSCSTGRDDVWLQKIYPCKNAMNPHLESFERRLETFDRRWNGDQLTATPRKIAEAGFFFLDESDRTKCFYCNGGLQNWEPNDNPMIEHAKYFPGCEYVLRVLGPEMVKQLVEKFPNIQRPTITNSIDYAPGIVLLQNIRQSYHQDSALLDWFYQSEIVRPAFSMGFTKEDIKETIDRRWQNEGCVFATFEDLLEELTATNDSEVTDMAN